MAKPRGRTANKKGRKPGAPVVRKRRPLLKPEDLDWKNYPALRRFLSERGKIRARRITGLSRRQQSMLSAAVKRAREMGLLPYPDQDRKVRIQRGGTDGLVTSASVAAVDGVDAATPEEIVEIETDLGIDEALTAVGASSEDDDIA